MEFTRARTEEQVQARKNEILNACAKLYDDHGLDGVNFKAIGEMTSFTRPTIYKYYSAKEEILLELLLEDLKDWDRDLQQMCRENETMTKEAYCRNITDSYTNHDRMMRLLSILFSNLEENCSVEKLTHFKKQMTTLNGSLVESLSRFFSHVPEEKRMTFLMAVSGLVLGLYPYTHLSDKQLQAMELAGINHIIPDFSQILYNSMIMLMSDF